MKNFFLSFTAVSLFFSIVGAAPTDNVHQNKSSEQIFYSKTSNPFPDYKIKYIQQNLIGEVTAIDSSSSKITIKTDAGASITVLTDTKTVFKRAMPGQTSIANAEQISWADIKVGDRVLIPGASATPEQTPARQVVVMAREAITSNNQQAEARRARTTIGRVTAINADKKEIIIQSRGREAVETLIVTASDGTKLLRYAPDSLKVSDARAGSFADIKVGDQVRIVGDRNADNTRVTSEEIISGTIVRSVGSIVDVNVSRGEVTVKNIQTGQKMTFAVSQNTSVRRITDDLAKTLKENAKLREERLNQQANNTQSTNQQANPNAANSTPQAQASRNIAQQLEALPAINVAELRKGDAIMITGTGGTENVRMTAVAIVTGDADLQQILRRVQGGQNGQPRSPGLPGNVGGGNGPDDDDPPNRE